MSMEEIEEAIVPLYYMQKINFDFADECVKETLPLWRKLPKEGRLRDLLTEEAQSDRAIRNNTLYGRQWTMRASESRFTALSTLNTLLVPGMWPQFDVTTEDAKKKAAIDVWSELIPMSAEAQRIRATINETMQQINTALHSRPSDMRSEEYRGWYVCASTTRRTTYGWVVGGRGNTLQILPDPVPGVRRIAAGGTNEHVKKVTAEQAAAAVAVQTVNGVASLNQSSDAVEKYSMKTANIIPIYPPDIALERKVWVSTVLRASGPHWEQAKANWKERTEWNTKVTPLRVKQQQYERWTNGVPKDLANAWFNPSDPPSIYGTESPGIREALLILSRKAGMSMDDLREAMVLEYMELHPDQVLTEAEQTLIDNPPAMGKDSVTDSLAELLVKEVGRGLLPPF
jgi:hypothetical protein